MRSHVWTIDEREFDFARAIEKLDRKTRQIGFHVLHDWDGIADRVNDDTIPVDVLHYLIDRRGEEPASAARWPCCSITTSCTCWRCCRCASGTRAMPTRTSTVWTSCCDLLQGPDGSGQPFATDAETLLLIATSHYEMYERGLCSPARATCGRSTTRHQTNIALGPRGEHGLSSAFRIRGDLRPRHHQHARRQRRRLPVVALRAQHVDAASTIRLRDRPEKLARRTTWSSRR